MNNSISSKSVSFKYLHQEHPALKNINFEFKESECLLFCGESGSGKSTLSRLFNGISPNYIEGELEGDLAIFSLKAGTTEIEEYVPVVGSVFQNPKTQHFTVNSTSELAFPMENMGIEPKLIKQTIQEKTKAFDIEHLLDRNLNKLSGGEKQQISFVAANMLSPKILVLDEVTSNLDQAAIIRVSRMIEYLKQKGMTILIFEHRLSWTKEFVDRYIMLENGSIEREWTNAEFQQLSNEELNALGLRSMNLEDHRQEIQNMESFTTENTGLKIEQLMIGYSTIPIQEELNLSIEAGKVSALMGPNGAGKSTLANTITGLQSPLAGNIYLNGKKMDSKALIKKSFLVMQDMNYQLFSDSVLDEVLLGAKHADQLDKVIDALNLTEYQNRHPMSLSEGQKQRVAIASALLSGKEIIVFDEPTSGLDYRHMERFGQLLEQLKQTSCIIIVISHDEELVSQWCDHVIRLEPVNNY